MKTLRNTLVALGLAGSAVLAQAAPVVLDFEGVGDFNPVGDFYDGGAGTNYGIFFSPATFVLVDADAGGSGNFANAPSPSSVLFFLEDDNAYLNHAAGFMEGFSLFYSSAVPAVVRVYDGLNGAGNILASLALDAQFDMGCSGDPGGLFCNFTPVGASFAGIARSVDFGGTANQSAFDNLTFGLAIPGSGGSNNVPEPATLPLTGIALAALGLSRRRGVQSRR